MYLWIKAVHILFMVCWFAGLFYLPRLFVYHAEAADQQGRTRFQTMERRLYWGIMLPSMVLTVASGLWLLWLMPVWLQQGWMHAKLTLVVLLIIYHHVCGRYVRQFAAENNRHSSRFYRLFNEVPVLFLCAIVALVVVKPF
ncbi:MAG: protoporphyrinogen oxidase HemJ [Kistimonas sp.]|nr:protoporphyrinogen oxidase HemJ [Kistimonas sp.]